MQKKQQRSKISVCMPVYNNQDYVEQAISSVLNQTYQDYELVIVNDASTDNVEDIILSFNNYKLKYYKNKVNLGQYPTINKAIQHSTRKYINILCQDDWFQPNLLEKFTGILDKYPQVGLVLCATRWVDPNGELITIAKTFSIGTIIPGERAFYHFLTKGNFGAALSSLMIRRKCFEKLGLFKNLYKSSPWGNNWEMNMRVSAFYDVAYLDESLVSVRRHEGSATTSTYEQDLDIPCDYKTLQYVFQNSEGVYLPVDQGTKRKALTRISQRAISRSAQHIKQRKFIRAIKLLKTVYEYDCLIRNILSFTRSFVRSSLYKSY